MKNIVVLSDGTGNGAAKNHKTNIWRLYEAIDLHNENQIAMYDDGVGSKDTLINKVLGGAFGFGLRRNVIEMYKFLSREYREDETSADKIYLFGFSRGAFTVRVLAGLVTSIGLCRDWDGPADLDRQAEASYQEYRQKYLHALKGEDYQSEIDSSQRLVPGIEFIGVWDTVDAYGFPIDEVAELWHRYVYPYRFSNRNLSKKVQRACHVISIDDERNTFHPVLWNEDNGKEERIKQLWFAGVHADVGGGYPRRSLSLVSLDWMITQVEASSADKGLVFIEQVRELYHRQSDWNGPHHDSRSRLGVFYRYRPREISKLIQDDVNKVFIDMAKIHRSVFERIKGHGQQYFPIGIPGKYLALTNTGETRSYESDSDASERLEAMKSAWGIVKSRSRLYLLIVITSMLIVLSGFIPVAIVGDSCAKLIPSIAWLEASVKDKLPDFLGGWIESLFCNIWISGLLLALLIALLIADKKAKQKLSEFAVKAWQRLNR